ATDVGQEQVVHGTFLRHWLKIRSEGLRKMSRNHIHLCLGLPGSGVVSGMREDCNVAIFVNLAAAMEQGVKFMQSSNGVILTPGEGEGVLAPGYFASAVWLGPNSQRVKIYDSEEGGDLLAAMREQHPDLDLAVQTVEQAQRVKPEVKQMPRPKKMPQLLKAPSPREEGSIRPAEPVKPPSWKELAPPQTKASAPSPSAAPDCAVTPSSVPAFQDVPDEVYHGAECERWDCDERSFDRKDTAPGSVRVVTGELPEGG
ncbi:unnamed protein product, partial [Effrenium voratum]